MLQIDHSRVDPCAAAILAIFAQAGFDAWLVGGCVRDLLRGEAPKDWDVASAAHPEQTAALFQEKGYAVIPTGLAHGTLTLCKDGKCVEVTTFRGESGYTDGRHPDHVEFLGEVEGDLSRRDFTVNAMAWSPRHGLLDPYGGLADLQRNVLRCVGEPDRRFAEDGLRIFRALRFSAVLDFSIEEKTAQSMVRMRAMLRKIAQERLRTELEKLLCAPGQACAAALGAYLPVVGEVIPELLPLRGCPQNTPYHLYDVWEHTLRAVQAAPPVFLPRLCALLHDIAKPLCRTTDASGRDHFKGHDHKSAAMAREILTRLRFDNRTAAMVTTVIYWHDLRPPAVLSSVRRAVAKIGPEYFPLWLEIKQADRLAQNLAYGEPADLPRQYADLYRQILREGQCVTLAQLQVGGSELIALGFAPGKALGKALKTLLDEVIEGVLANEKEPLLCRARALLREGQSAINGR